MENDRLLKKDVQAEKANLLRRLHRNPPLLLPNAWDALSARVFEKAGYPAIGTTSGGIAWSLGYSDGETLPRQEMLAATARIARSVNVPVTADIEAGFGATPEAVAETVRLVIGAGVVGINLEDHFAHGDGTLLDVAEATERIRACRQAAQAAGIPLVINARTDVYLHGNIAPAERLHEAVRRAKAYMAAGADCIYPIGVVDSSVIGALATASGAPLNVWARPGMPELQELGRLGVVRVSMAVGPCLVAMSALHHMAAELRATGRFDNLAPNFTYQDIQSLFAGR